MYKKLEELGFFEWLDTVHNLVDTDMKPEYLDRLPLDDIHRTVCNAMIFRWFREKYGLVGTIEAAYHTKKENHMFAYTIWEGRVENYGGCNWDVFEEAENACIDKLIELAKKQDNDTNPK
jgi:hypothetical protein